MDIIKNKKLKICLVLILLIIMIIALTIEFFLIKSELQITKLKKQEQEERIKELNGQIKTLGRQAEQEKLNKSIKELEEKNAELTDEKKLLESKIKTLKEDIIKEKGKAKTYPAGHLSVSTDIPTGKYKIYDGKGNFVVHSANGSLEVNIILGGTYGIKEYIYTFKEGDKVETNASFKLISVE